MIELSSDTLCDLHMHTWFSDGDQSPEAVAEACRQKGIGLAAVCDHNNTEAQARFAAACRAEGLAFVPGIEIDADFAGRALHLLAYGCNAENAPLQSLLARHSQMLEALSTELIAAMQADYPQLSSAEYAAFERNPAHGGWKGLDYLGAKGLDNVYPGAMRWYAQYGIPPRRFTDTRAVIAAIHAAGGKAVLAHPWQRLEAETLVESLQSLAEQGLDGLECYYPSHTPAMTQSLLTFCRTRGLLITAGGDGHGAFAARVNGVDYGIGQAAMSLEELNLAGLLSG